VKAGKKAAFSTIYDKYAPSLYGIALAIVKNEDDAKDVLQESFVKFWMKINSYDSNKGSFFTWMLNITRNTAIDKYRRNKKSNKLFTSDLSAVMYSIGIERGTDTIGLRDLINQLSKEQIEIVNELYFNGSTQKEASDKLNLPLGTVKSRIRSALKRLREIYGIK